MEDGRIIDLFFERSEQAVRELEAKYGRGVKALALNILGDVRDAEECAADTYLAVWNSVPPIRPEHLKAYTLAIARNLSLDRYQGIRARKRNSSYDLALSELEDCLASEGDAETELEARELAQAVNRFLAGLSKEDRQRQQELREQLQIDGNQVEEYTEYPLPEETGEAAPSDGELTVTLLSSIGGVEYDSIYINVSPFEKEWIRGQLPVGASFDGGESFAICTPAMKNGEMIYDEATKTITFECHRFHSSPYTDEMIVACGHGDGKMELGRFQLSISEVETRLCLFEKPVEFSVDELGKTGRLLGVELYSGGMTWLLEYEDAEKLYWSEGDPSFEEMSPEDQQWKLSVEAAWAQAEDSICRGTLHMADGSELEVYGGESGSFENGIVKRYGSFSLTTIDPDDVVSITLFDGSTVELD